MHQEKGFSLFELLLVISLVGIFLVASPGVEKVGFRRIDHQNEVQRMVDLLRLAQRRAILTEERQYLTLEPSFNRYRLYELGETGEELIKQVTLTDIDLLGVNRSVDGMEQSFYFTPLGTPVFGCTISLQDQWNLYKIVIAVGSGKVRIERG